VGCCGGIASWRGPPRLASEVLVVDVLGERVVEVREGERDTHSVALFGRHSFTFVRAVGAVFLCSSGSR